VRTLVVLTIVALAARALAGADAAAAVRAETAAGAHDPYATIAGPLDAHRPITSPSTFAIGVATLAALGLLHWRRRRFAAETAAL
jgi:hypothetical protein